MSKPVIVYGEASETESEDELFSENINITKLVQGAVINGEDSESDNEIDASLSSAHSALDQTNIKEKPQEAKYDSLFHQKLRECNSQFHNNIQIFCVNTIQGASKHLDAIDQQLLKSQLTLQNAVTSLKSLTVNSSTIRSKLDSLLSTKFLVNVNLDK